MQVNQRFVWSKHSCAQITLADRDVADQKYFVVEWFHARGDSRFLEHRVELPQVHVIKRSQTRLDRPRATNVEQHRTDGHATRNHRDVVGSRKLMPLGEMRIGK